MSKLNPSLLVRKQKMINSDVIMTEQNMDFTCIPRDISLEIFTFANENRVCKDNYIRFFNDIEDGREWSGLILKFREKPRPEDLFRVLIRTRKDSLFNRLIRKFKKDLMYLEFIKTSNEYAINKIRHQVDINGVILSENYHTAIRPMNNVHINGAKMTVSENRLKNIHWFREYLYLYRSDIRFPIKYIDLFEDIKKLEDVNFKSLAFDALLEQYPLTNFYSSLLNKFDIMLFEKLHNLGKLKTKDYNEHLHKVDYCTLRIILDKFVLPDDFKIQYGKMTNLDLILLISVIKKTGRRYNLDSTFAECVYNRKVFNKKMTIDELLGM